MKMSSSRRKALGDGRTTLSKRAKNVWLDEINVKLSPLRRGLRHTHMQTPGRHNNNPWPALGREGRWWEEAGHWRQRASSSLRPILPPHRRSRWVSRSGHRLHHLLRRLQLLRNRTWAGKWHRMAQRGEGEAGLAPVIPATPLPARSSISVKWELDVYDDLIIRCCSVVCIFILFSWLI